MWRRELLLAQVGLEAGGVLTEVLRPTYEFLCDTGLDWWKKTNNTPESAVQAQRGEWGCVP